jgi:hypothetical protein
MAATISTVVWRSVMEKAPHGWLGPESLVILASEASFSPFDSRVSRQRFSPWNSTSRSGRYL